MGRSFRAAGWCVLFWALPLAAQTAPELNLPEKNPFDSPAGAAEGRQYYLGHCAHCHGPDGEGGRGTNLTTGRYRHGDSDRELFRTIKRGIPGSEMPGSRLIENEVWKLVAYVRRLGAAGAEEKAAGNPEAGRKVYETNGCTQCHVVDGRGGSLGPDLSEIGLRRSLKFLRDSLTDPSAYVADAYKQATVLTRTGERVSGTILNEDDYSIQLRDMRENLRSFLKSNLKELKREKQSLMPAYGGALPATQIDDLVAYMSLLR